MMNSVENITQHILAYAKGEKIELGIIVDALYEQLCIMANIQLNKINPNSITPHELVHEVYLKFSNSLSINANGRNHFLALAATAMRQLIIDQCKVKFSLKRGGNICFTTLTDSKLPIQENMVEILLVHKALENLKKMQPKLSATVECRYFAGYTDQETADALGVNIRTVRRYWKRAKKWLFLELDR